MEQDIEELGVPLEGAGLQLDAWGVTCRCHHAERVGPGEHWSRSGKGGTPDLWHEVIEEESPAGVHAVFEAEEPRQASPPIEVDDRLRASRVALAPCLGGGRDSAAARWLGSWGRCRVGTR
ncbi:hypothetical protein PR202_gb25604 [Eleusine coracana subsp. coracana]|uniref:Uncharacterized protein n=1 Tax=Eleusine coracana subsp. coracana TaxID=191504 RepID=A0AAV5FQF0_ELECO|nr:hypothetical protein PR202_gb25604 [Eleusine coracana subsp. coracana]